MTDREINKFLENLKQFDGLSLERRMEEYAKIWPKMTEEEARKLLYKYLQNLCKHSPDLRVWLGQVIHYDYTGWIIQGEIYRIGETPGQNWHSWGVDALRKTCGPNIM